MLVVVKKIENMVFGSKRLRFMTVRGLCGIRSVKLHVAKTVLSNVQDQNVKINKQPPYSPDLAPLDFWLFDYIKQRLEDAVDVQSLYLQITKIIKKIP